ncbi:phospholipase A1-like [Contarinia nasturtii]|uniref:phospholipase A1-like n=1 Tax=Contarinia nasturtii TaxID=265458 RepID=UPI0012D4C26E|nr:phospholipase A1-like [Contarinia nasturtii]
MKFRFYTVFLVLFLYECAAMMCGRCATDEKISSKNFEYEGDAIKFSCIYKEGQPQFYAKRFNATNSHLYIQRIASKLNNGRGLSLFFLGIANTITIDGIFFKYAKEWFSKTDKNICIITYAYSSTSTTLFNILFHVNQMVSTKRLDFVAKQAQDLVLETKKKCEDSRRTSCLRHMSQVEVVGFSFGAHIAGLTCGLLFEKTGEKVKILLALDPAGTSFFWNKPGHMIKSGDADYVQVIHTSAFGLDQPVGDVDIYVDSTSNKILLGAWAEKHALSVYLHIATSTKRLFIIAEVRGNGILLISERQPRELKPQECQIGIYGTLQAHHKGKQFNISIVDREDTTVFWDALGELGGKEMLV